MKRFSSPLTYNFQSGIFDIDRFLDETKSKSNNNNSSTTISDNNNNNNKSSLKWIPYNEFSNIKEIGKGGFGVVYEAIWHDAPEQKIDLIWNKKRVALKVLRYSTNDDQSTDFLNEVNLIYIYISFIISLFSLFSLSHFLFLSFHNVILAEITLSMYGFREGSSMLWNKSRTSNK